MTPTASERVRGEVRSKIQLLSCLGVTAVAVLGLAGCKVGPNYRPPRVEMPGSFRSGPATQPAGAAATTQPATDLCRWWASLNDPVLDLLVRRAVEGNLSLAIAFTRVEEARYQQAVTAAGLWPFVGFASGGPGHLPLYGRASSTLERGRFVTNPGGLVQLRQSATAGGLSGPPSLYLTAPGRHPQSVLITPGANGQPASVNLRPSLLSPKGNTKFINRDQFAYEGMLEAAWELDVFGGIRRAVEAANADMQAAVEARNDVLVMLLGDTATAYVELRGFQRRLEIAKENIRRQRWIVELVQTKVRAQITSDLDLALAERQLAATEAQVPVLEAAIAQAQHRLSVLMGMMPEDLPPEVAEPRPMAPPPPEVPVGLPSELLEQRPDIRRAERELAAETARIGVATAQLFPHFILTGSFGVQTSDIRKLLNADSMIWSGGPGIRWPIFEGGQIIGNIHVEEARAKEALLRYRATLLTAVQEVEDALAGYSGQRSRYLNLPQAVDASQRAYRLAQDRYDKGLTDFLNVLDAQRQLYVLEDEAALSQQELLVQLVALYRALGRGWDVCTAPPRPATQPSA